MKLHLRVKSQVHPLTGVDLKCRYCTELKQLAIASEQTKQDEKQDEGREKDDKDMNMDIISEAVQEQCSETAYGESVG